MLTTGRTSSLDGTQIAFSEWGNPRGAPVVLIHGWLFSRLAFARQVHGELADRCRVIAYDLRGHGESGRPETLSAYSDGNVWAADLDAVLRAVGVERPTLSGWSLGGRVAAHYVFAHGAAGVAGLNLVASRVLQKPSALVNGTINGGPESFLRGCTYQPLSQDEFDSFLRVALSVPPVARDGASAWHIEYGDFFDELALPVLVTHGDSDSVTLPVAAENIARRLQGALSIFPRCGHMPFWEQPERFNHELAEFADNSCHRLLSSSAS